MGYPLELPMYRLNVGFFAAVLIITTKLNKCVINEVLKLQYKFYMGTLSLS